MLISEFIQDLELMIKDHGDKEIRFSWEGVVASPNMEDFIITHSKIIIDVEEFQDFGEDYL